VLPGGAVDKGEALPDAARREAQEECGVDVTIGRAIWLREFVDRRRGQTNLEVYFLAEPAAGARLPDRWQHADRDEPGLVRHAGLYSREELRSIEMTVYPVELREAFWLGLANGFADAYLGRVESES
jgi:ADP-ribose pyrophosphatase YjhB (NUDIX family)